MKTNLERAARRRKVSMSSLLAIAADEWLTRSAIAEDDSERQRALHAAASQYIGVFASGQTRRSEGVREAVRERLRRRHGR